MHTMRQTYGASGRTGQRELNGSLQHMPSLNQTPVACACTHYLSRQQRCATKLEKPIMTYWTVYRFCIVALDGCTAFTKQALVVERLGN